MQKSIEASIPLFKIDLSYPTKRGKSSPHSPLTFPEQNLDTFIELLTQQRSLFSSEQLTELAQLVEPLPDEIESLSNAIANWIETRLEIAEAQAKE